MYNWPLVRNESYEVENVNVVVMNLKIVYYDMSLLFSDPEDEPITYFYASGGQSPLRNFMKDLHNGTLAIQSTSYADLGQHNMEIVGVDSAGQYTVISFVVIVKRKDFYQ